MEEIDSEVFGKTNLLDENEEDFNTLKHLIDKFPANAFGIINKKMNENGRGYNLILNIHNCNECKSVGFKHSITGKGCTFCDGTEGGNPPSLGD